MRFETERGAREAARRRALRRRLRRRLGAAALVVLAWTAAVVALTRWVGASAPTADREQPPAGAITVLGNLARAWLDPEPLPALRLDIKFKHLHRMHEKRDAAIHAGLLIAEPGDFVPARIGLGGPPAPAHVRLIGPEPAHFAGEVWSIEVRMDGDVRVAGMRRFSILAPAVAGAPLAQLASRWLADQGLATPRVTHAELVRNGDRLGPVVLRELPGKPLLEASRRTPAPIVHLDSRAYWRSIRDNGAAGPFDNPFTARPVAGADDASGAADSEAAAGTASGLLRGFLLGRLPARAVFDVPQTARWLAAAEFWNDPRMLDWTRASFHLDPLDAVLVPIATLPEPGAAGAADGQLLAPRSALAARLLEDDEVRHHFARAMRELAERAAQGDPRWAELEAGQRRLLRALQRRAPRTAPVDLGPRIRRIASLGGVESTRAVWFAPAIARGDFRFPAIVAARAARNREGPFVEIDNLLPVPVLVTTLRHEADDGTSTPVTLASRTPFPIELPPTPAGERPRPVRVHYRKPNSGAIPDAVGGMVRIAGEQREQPFRAPRATPALDAPPVPTATLEEALALHPFLVQHPGDLALHTAPGLHVVSGSLVLPAGMGLIVEAGTELVFAPREGIVLRGPLDIRGSPEAPVVLRGDPARRGGRWHGVAVLRSLRPLALRHVEIRGAVGFERPGWSVPAAVAIRNADVSLAHVRIRDTAAASALALFDARFSLEDVVIERSAGTGLRLERASGKASGLVIDTAGEDGIVARTSGLVLDGGRLARIHATALIASGDSDVSARALEIDGASIGVAASDGARMRISRSALRHIAHVPLLAYRERAERGGGQIVAHAVAVEGAARPALAQRGSSIEIDGEPVPTVAADLGRLHPR